jgi:hypothetical protein
MADIDPEIDFKLPEFVMPPKDYMERASFHGGNEGIINHCG